VLPENSSTHSNVRIEASSPWRNGIIRPQARHPLQRDQGAASRHCKVIGGRDVVPLTSPAMVEPSPQFAPSECVSSTPRSVTVAKNGFAEPSTPVTSVAVHPVGATLVTVTVIVWPTVLPSWKSHSWANSGASTSNEPEASSEPGDRQSQAASKTGHNRLNLMARGKKAGSPDFGLCVFSPKRAVPHHMNRGRARIFRGKNIFREEMQQLTDQRSGKHASEHAPSRPPPIFLPKNILAHPTARACGTRWHLRDGALSDAAGEGCGKLREVVCWRTWISS
jgi:hypothetical protein